MTTPLLRPPEWTTAADCNGLTSGTFDPWDEDLQLTTIARRICATCPVRFPCLVDAVLEGTTHTIRGGLTTRERRPIARHLGVDAPGAAAHGTRSRYVAGCRCRPCRRAHATYEHDRRLRARNRLTLLPPVLDHRTGRGRWTAWPGQTYLVFPGTTTARQGADNQPRTVAA